MKRPGRGTLRTTFATRDQLGFLADCSWFRRWTAADGPGMPKIRLAPPSALTCDVQHGQHEEVTKHLRFSSRKCHSAQNVVCTVVRLTCAFEAAILRFHQSPTRSVTVRSWCGRKHLQSRICQTDMKRPGRGTLRTTFATRDQLGFLADCSWFRRWTAADGPGMPKIRLAPPSALTCDVQHGQHEEVTKHLRFSSRKCHSAQNVVCTVVRLTCAFEAAILRFHQSPTQSVTVRSWCGENTCNLGFARQT